MNKKTKSREKGDKFDGGQIEKKIYVRNQK